METKKRLTEKHYNGKGYYMKCSGLCCFDGHCADCDELVKIVDRLGEYEDKAKQIVDAVEVVHGRWEKMDTRYVEQFKCSVCRSEVYVQTCMGEPMFNYCPHCGAKMDGDNQ